MVSIPESEFPVVRKLEKTEITTFGPLLNFAQSHLADYSDLATKVDINGLQSSQDRRKSKHLRHLNYIA